MDMTEFTGNSDFLKSTDLNRKQPLVKIKSVNTRDFSDEAGTKTKPIIEFEGKDKMMVLNVTNTRRLVEAFGKDSDKWIGKEVQLYVEDTQMGPGLRLRAELPDFDDDIPF